MKTSFFQPALQPFLNYRARAAVRHPGPDSLYRLEKALAAGADPNTTVSKDIGTLLHALVLKQMSWRADGDELLAIRMLLESGANPNRVGGTSQTTPFWVACAGLQDAEGWQLRATAQLLAEHGGDSRVEGDYHTLYDGCTRCSARVILERILSDTPTNHTAQRTGLQDILTQCNANDSELLRQRLQAIAVVARVGADAPPANTVPAENHDARGFDGSA